MISLIRKMLEVDDFIGVSKEIDIAKGLYETPLTIKQGLKQRKRRNGRSN